MFPITQPDKTIMKNPTTELTLNNLQTLRFKVGHTQAIVDLAGDKATANQKANAAKWKSEFERLYPLIIKANAHRFPADVVAGWLNQKAI